MLFQPQPLQAPENVGVEPPSGVSAYLLNQPYTFSASVSPLTSTLPITYLWQATDYAPRTVVGGPTNDQTYTWGVEGMKHVTVTVDNGLGSPKVGTLAVELRSDANYPVYLPLVLRNK
jgi:hypothetical protein